MWRCRSFSCQPSRFQNTSCPLNELRRSFFSSYPSPFHGSALNARGQNIRWTVYVFLSIVRLSTAVNFADACSLRRTEGMLCVLVVEMRKKRKTSACRAFLGFALVKKRHEYLRRIPYSYFFRRYCFWHSALNFTKYDLKLRHCVFDYLKLFAEGPLPKMCNTSLCGVKSEIQKP